MVAFRRRREILFWGGTALGAWVLNLGPSLHLWGRNTFAGWHIPLPYAGLYFLPFFNIVRVPARFMVLTMLALAVLAGYALAAAQAGRWKRAASSAGAARPDRRAGHAGAPRIPGAAPATVGV